MKDRTKVKIALFDILGSESATFPLILQYISEFLANNVLGSESEKVQGELKTLTQSLPCNFTLSEQFYSQLIKVLEGMPNSKQTRKVKRNLSCF